MFLTIVCSNKPNSASLILIDKQGFAVPRTPFLGFPSQGERVAGPKIHCTRVGPHLHAMFQPIWPRVHVWGSSSCTCTCCLTPRWGLGPNLSWPVLMNSEVPFHFCLMKFSHKCAFLALPTNDPVLGPEQNAPYNLQRIERVLLTQFQLGFQCCARL